MKIVGNKIYVVCSDCTKLVQVNKFIVGGLHACTTPEERQKYSKEIAQEVLRMKIWLEDTK